MEDINKDKRFGHVAKDPRFRRMKRTERKVQIDKRFNAMFKDKNFKVKYTVDKRGRAIQASSTDHLRKFYELDESDTTEDDSDDELKVEKKSKKKEKKSKTKVKSKNDIQDVKTKKTLNKVESIQKKDGTKLKPKGTIISKTEKESANQEELEETAKRKVHKEESKEKESSEDDDSEKEDEEEDSSEEDDLDLDIDSTTGMVEGGQDMARGQGNMASSSEEEESDDTDVDAEAEQSDDELDHGWGEFDREAPVGSDVTRRFAACNLDWDRIKAADLMVLFNSFKPQGGVIKSVKIYPSEFGLERMALEEKQGPAEIRDELQSVDIDAEEEEKKKDDDDDTEGNDYSREKLRKYQLNRLKYYYAVVECDNENTANTIYEECDGMEYETSSTRLDLRFIPDDMTFEQEPKSAATDAPDVASYKPSQFVTTALTNTKVECTWDETDPDRVQILRRNFTDKDLEQMDLDNYLASSSSEDEGAAGLQSDDDEDEDGGKKGKSEEQQINKYRQLLLDLDAKKEEKEKKDKEMEMEITFEPGLKEAAESMVKQKLKSKEGLSPWESYLEKKKEKKKKRREEKKEEKALREGLNEAPDVSIKDDKLPDGIDLNDPYFREEMGNLAAPAAGSKADKKKKKGRRMEEDAADKQEQDELALLMDDEDDMKNHFNLKTIMENEKKKKKKKKKSLPQETVQKEDNFEIDVKDDRFSAIYSSHLFNIDPTAPEFKKTKSTDALLKEKMKRIKDGGGINRKRKVDKTLEENPSKLSKTNSPASKPGGLDPSLSSLVKSLKAKTQSYKDKKEKKAK